MAQSDADGPLALNAAQMDNVTAGQLPVPVVTASALANATGQYTMSGTQTATWVSGGASPGSFTSALAPYITATDASSGANATGPDAQSSAMVGSVNEQPFPDNSVLTSTIQYSNTFLGMTIAFQSTMKFGGAAVYWFKAPLGW
jgi:hypothetical protein